jgi:hypothetical protein
LPLLLNNRETTAFSDWQDEQQPEENRRSFCDQDMKESLTDEESLLEEILSCKKQKKNFLKALMKTILILTPIKSC